MKENKLKDFISIMIKALTFALFFIATMNMVGFKDNLVHTFDDRVVNISSVIYIAFIVIAIILKNKIKVNLKLNKIIKYLFIILIFVFQIIYANMIYRDIGFDCGLVVNTAIDMANGTFTNTEYFSKYSNNIFLLLILEIIFKFLNLFNMNNYLLIAVIFNIIIIDIAIIFIYLTSKKILKSKYNFISLLFTIPMLAFSPYIGVVYSDTLSLIFPIAILYYYICYKEKPKNRYLFAITTFSTIGLLLKPTNIIVLIAIILIELLNMISKFIDNKINNNKNFNIKEKVKFILKSTSIVIVTFLLVYNSYTGYRNLKLGKYISEEDYQNNGFPYTHFIMMGLKPTDVEGKYYGVYSEDDVIATQQQIGVENKKEYNIEEIKKRLSKMGIKGYISYLYDKYTFIISDGTFFYGLEGSFYKSLPYNSSNLAKEIQEYVYVKEEGYVKYTSNIYQGIWTSVIIIILITTALNFRKKETQYIDIARLAIIGIIMFIVLFEARSRYLINYLPIFTIVLSYGILDTTNKIEIFIDKKRRKRLNEA